MSSNMQTFVVFQTRPHFLTPDVAVRSIKVMRVKCESCLLLVIASHWDPAWLSVWSSQIHRFHILQTIMGSRPTGATILRYDKLPSWQSKIRLLSKSDTYWEAFLPSYTRHHNNFSPGNNIQMLFVHEKPAELLYLNTLLISLLPLIFYECVEKLSIKTNHAYHSTFSLSA